MSAQPTKAGTYRVKVYNTTTTSYWKYIADDTRWIQLAGLESSNDAFLWYISPVGGVANTYTIRPATDVTVGFGTSTNSAQKYWGYGFPQGYVNQAALWTIQPSGTSYSTISLRGGQYVVDSVDKSSLAVHFYQSQGSAPNQKWVFEAVAPHPEPGPQPIPSGKTFEDLFFMLTPEEAAKQEYDIIIVGTGIGGGIIAGDLFDTNSMLGEGALSVLVIEKGYLPFHSHCLNAARPTGFGEDRGQQNDTFFALFKDDYKFSSSTKTSDWKGGPMYNVGGRSAAWGLFLPRIHDSTLKAQFAADTPTLYNDLVRTWYRQAESLMNLSLPTTTPEHLNVMERLNMKNNSNTPSDVLPRDVQWEWGRIASEFSDEKNYDFAKGAYSTIDKILEIAMSKDRRSDGTLIEHPNWRILIGTEVESILWADDSHTCAGGVVVRGPDGSKHDLKLKSNPGTGKVSKLVLAAGSVASPAILMRSGKTDFLQTNGGLHITDHDIFAKGFTFQFANPADQERVGAMKLQTYVNVKDEIILVNISVNADSFLPRSFLSSKYYRNTDYPKLILAFIRPCELNKNNTISLDADNQPVVTINRERPFSNSDQTVHDLQTMANEIVEVLEETLGIIIRQDEDEDEDEDNYFKALELGGVAHELGTIPMQGAKKHNYCVEPNLQLRGHENIYVCDLSVFPYSPEVNPTLTLAALALRLSREVLLPPIPFITKSINDVLVLNQSGENVQVYVSNQAGVVRDGEDKLQVLGPGKFLKCKRKAGIAESVMVFRLAYNETDKYQTVPILYVAIPGKVTTI